MSAVEDGNQARADLHAVLRPVRSRWVALILAVTQSIVLLLLAVSLPPSGPVAFRWFDRTGVVLVGAFVAWGLSRFARVRVEPREDGVTVHNVLLSRDLAWAQIVAVRFGGGGPWVTLDLDDGDSLAVMAIQRAEGARGVEQARRLATLVALHSRTSRDD